VWVYGGGFGGGRTSDPLFNGAPLANKGVVYVSLAYRVGVMGFMAHPALSAENATLHGSAASGNYGLLDLVSGLPSPPAINSAWCSGARPQHNATTTLSSCRSWTSTLPGVAVQKARNSERTVGT